jgi:hypothetical protein
MKSQPREGFQRNDGTLSQKKSFENFCDRLVVFGVFQQERLEVILAANAAMVLFYWDVGKTILAKQQSAG